MQSFILLVSSYSCCLLVQLSIFRVSGSSGSGSSFTFKKSVVRKEPEEEVISSLLDHLLDGYDRRVRPHFGGPPVSINISMFILSILRVNEMELEFQVDMYFRQKWVDPRLAFFEFTQQLKQGDGENKERAMGSRSRSNYTDNLDDHQDDEEYYGGVAQDSEKSGDEVIEEEGVKRRDYDFEFFQELKLGHEFSHKIWNPDSFFPNEKSSQVHSATVKNEFFRISPHGEVLKSTRFTLTLTCPMDLRLFPMDTQICQIKVESYGSNVNQLSYNWGRKPGNVNQTDFGLQFPHDILPHFKIVGYRTNHTKIAVSSGNYSTLIVEIQLKRHLGYYIMQVYIPSSLLVIVSWFSLWMDRACVSERMGMVCTILLTITMLLSTVNATAPKIPYVKAIDVFMGICFAFIFASLMENATVGYLGKGRFWPRGKRQRRSRQQREQQSQDLIALDQTIGSQSPFKMNERKMKRKKNNNKGIRTNSSIKRQFQSQGYLHRDRRSSSVKGLGGHFSMAEIKPLSPNSRSTPGRKDSGHECNCKGSSWEREDSREISPWPAAMDNYARMGFPCGFFVVNVVYWYYYLEASLVDPAGWTLLK